MGVLLCSREKSIHYSSVLSMTLKKSTEKHCAKFSFDNVSAFWFSPTSLDVRAIFPYFSPDSGTVDPVRWIDGGCPTFARVRETLTPDEPGLRANVGKSLIVVKISTNTPTFRRQRFVITSTAVECSQMWGTRCDCGSPGPQSGESDALDIRLTPPLPASLSAPPAADPARLPSPARPGGLPRYRRPARPWPG